MITLAVMSGKGGVGKSTVAANLATALSEKGNEVGILDSDFHGPTIPKLLGIKNGRLRVTEDEEMIPLDVKQNLKAVSIDLMQKNKDAPVIWRGPMKMKMIKNLLNDVKWNNLDYLIIDLPPGTGDEPLSIAQEIEDINGSVIVTTPQEVSIQSVRKSIQFSREVNMPVIGLVENMGEFICPNCGESTNIFGSGGGEELANELDIPYLGSVPLDPEIVKSGEKGEPFVNKENKSSIAFEEIVERIIEEVE